MPFLLGKLFLYRAVSFGQMLSSWAWPYLEREVRECVKSGALTHASPMQTTPPEGCSALPPAPYLSNLPSLDSLNCAWELLPRTGEFEGKQLFMDRFQLLWGGGAGVGLIWVGERFKARRV